MSSHRLRNIGISAHIDSGKTTLSERILFYAGRLHRMEEVHDGGGATMDHMDLEKERGITITSAATQVEWDQHRINLIDTPGHVDFTVEVERSLRVLDGAILVLCGVGGVQSQSLTVDRQIKRYGVPRLVFINKLDRTGADPVRVCQEVRDKLGVDALMMQLPIGLASDLAGVIDLVAMQAIYFDGENGQDLRCEEIPEEMLEEARLARTEMLESLSMYDDELMEVCLADQEPPEPLIHRVVRNAVRSLEIAPVFLGSAYRNKGVQPLLDAVVEYLPSPEHREITADAFVSQKREAAAADKTADETDGDGTGESSEQDGTAVDDSRIVLTSDPGDPLVAMTFKIVDDAFGQLTFTRIYQGTMERGEIYFNQRTGRKERFSRIFRMHADKREEVERATAGDIVAVMGIEAASGDTYASEREYCTLEGMFVPEPVIGIAVRARDRVDEDRLTKALQRFRREDPTFRVMTDPETKEIVIAGMGELHLSVYLERIRREYKVGVESGAPKVAYRESPTRAAEFNYKHRKQTGGSGQYAHIIGRLEVFAGTDTDPFEFEDNVVGGRIPRQFIPSVEKGFRQCLEQGPVARFPVIGVRVELDDGSYHDVDSSDKAFQTAAAACFRENFRKMKPVLLEPIMSIEIECPRSFQGSISGDLNSRRGLIGSSNMVDDVVTIQAQVPLSETFGYATDLRSLSQGQATFTMELHSYRRVPTKLQEEIVADRREAQQSGAGIQYSASV
ncbi:MAG: elongation factor G [Planctomycetaceae bacterium]|jgi:elongation factor G|nr:elongation factor G [Planctomycetaceae bacterium]MDP7275125.1 elongation factor G [Planctomycetaceae bacterium]